MEEEKSVLLVSYYFPPYAGVSTVRVTKHCKYLPRFGWKPQVLTVDERYYKNRVASSALNLKEAPVVRVPYFCFPFNILLIKLLFPFVVLTYVIKHRSEIDVVYFSGSPFHPFILSVVLNVFLKKPTVLDFRDSWSNNHGFDGNKTPSLFGKIKQWIAEKLERYSIKFASRVVYSTPVLQKEYEVLHPEFINKYKTISNGYDPDDFIGIKPVKVSDKVTIILAGQFSLYTPTAMNSLMRALKELPKLHFIYIGNEVDVIQKAAKLHSVEYSVTAFGYMPYQTVLRYIAGADYALLSNGVQNGMGTKIFDYLALNKTTLCFVPDGSVITQEFSGLDSVVISNPPYTVELLKKKLLELIQKEKMPAEQGSLNSFSRVVAAEELSLNFDEIVKR